jgi:hypothetical protein
VDRQTKSVHRPHQVGAEERQALRVIMRRALAGAVGQAGDLLDVVRADQHGPISGQRVNVKAPVSGEFATTLAQLGWLPELNNR